MTVGLFLTFPHEDPYTFNTLFHFYFVFLLYHSSFLKIVEVLISENSQRKPEKKSAEIIFYSLLYHLYCPLFYGKIPSELLTSISINYFPPQVYLMRPMIFFIPSHTSVHIYIQLWPSQMLENESLYKRKKKNSNIRNEKS